MCNCEEDMNDYSVNSNALTAYKYQPSCDCMIGRRVTGEPIHYFDRIELHDEIYNRCPLCDAKIVRTANEED